MNKGTPLHLSADEGRELRRIAASHSQPTRTGFTEAADPLTTAPTTV